MSHETTFVNAVGKDFHRVYRRLFPETVYLDGDKIRMSQELYNFVNVKRPKNFVVPWREVMRFITLQDSLDLTEENWYGEKNAYCIRRKTAGEDKEQYGGYVFDRNSEGIKIGYVVDLLLHQTLIFEPNLLGYISVGCYNCPNNLEIANAFGVDSVTVDTKKEIIVKEDKFRTVDNSRKHKRIVSDRYITLFFEDKKSKK